MNRRVRLIFLLISFAVLILVGRIITNSFDFIITQFWFTSGLFLLVLLSLIDQPNFSKDANIFINSVTAWMSLILIIPEKRDVVWWTFFSITSYLIISSYVLIWIRKANLKDENIFVAFFSRINREIGKPETIFSTFFIWGAIKQFGINTDQFDALLAFWVVFMILNMPALANSINKLFEGKPNLLINQRGIITKLIDPMVAEVLLSTDFEEKLIGRTVNILSTEKETIGRAVFIDERVISGARIGKIVITSTTDNWRRISDSSKGACHIKLIALTDTDTKHDPISVVDKGSVIGKLIFFLHPSIQLQEGEIIYVTNQDKIKVFYQIVEAIITEEISNEANLIQSVKVTATQLGLWNEAKKTFSPFSWVAPSGQLIYQGKDLIIDTNGLPTDYSIVGKVPNSNFPVHVNLADAVTHNTAIIGVTGSGKSYLAFHLIESLIKKDIRVMVLDLTREHYQYLHKHQPYILKDINAVKVWLNDECSSKLAIHQFATSASFPLTTYQFAKEAFDILSSAKLTAGKNLPAKLCIVLEEAHTLIPEWNQVAVQSDKDHVNNTARIILQGRKFGLGSVIITQRTANVTKTILNQCNTIFALQSFDQTGLEFLRNYMGDEYSDTLSKLQHRQAILVGKASSSQKPIILQINNDGNRWEDPPSTENPTEGGV